MNAKNEGQLLKLALDIGPLLIFFASFRYARRLVEVPAVRDAMEPLIGAQALAGHSGPLFVATAIFMLAILVSLPISWWKLGHIPRMALVTAVVVAVFGGLTLWLQDETFIKMKPTMVYGIFAVILGIGLVRGRSYLRSLMGVAMQLDDAGWIIFTRRWVLFFLGMALLNEAVWRTQTTDTWVSFKTFGTLPLTILFMGLQLPLLKRHMVEEN